MEILGRQVEVGVAVESARGTAESTPARWMRKVTATFVHKVTKAKDDAVRGRLEESEGARVTQKWYAGDLTGILHADMLGYFLYSIYGAVSSALVSGSSMAYDHTFTLEQSATHPTLTVFAKDGSVAQAAFGGALVGKLELSATVDDYLRFTASVEGCTENSDSSSPSYATEFDFIGRDVSVKIASTEAGLAGATALKVKNATVRWDVGSIRNHVFGSYNPDAMYNSKMAIEVELTRDFVDTTLRDLYTGDTATYMQITITGDADMDGDGSNPTVTLVLNKAQVMEWDRTSGADELVGETVKISGFFNATDAAQSSVVLRNLTEAYAA